MTFKTVEGVLHPDGKVTLPDEELPDRPVRVMVTILESTQGAALSDVGDYHEKLRDYEERLARGEIQWHNAKGG